MAKTLGELAVRLSAKTQGFMAEFDKAVKKTEELADEVEALASKGAAALGDMADGFLTVAAAATGAFVLGAQGNQQMADAMKELEGVTRTLAVEFGKELVPLVKEATQAVKTAVAYWRNLSDEQKKGVVEGVKWAFMLGTGTKALQQGIVFGKSFAEGTVAVARVAGPAAKAVSSGVASITAALKDAAVAVGGLGTAFAAFSKKGVGELLSGLGDKLGSGLDKAWAGLARGLMNLPATIASAAAGFKAMLVAAAPVVGTVLAVVAAVGALVVLAAVLRDAWAQSGDGITSWFEDVAGAAVKLGETITGFLGDMFNSLTGFLRKGMEVAFEYIASQVRWLAKLAAPIAKWAGAKELAAGFEQLAQTSGKKMLEYLDKGAKTLWDAGANLAEKAGDKVASVAGAVGDALKSGAKATGDILKTSMDSARRGFALLDKDLGISDLIATLSGKVPALPQAPSAAEVNAVGATDTLEAQKKAADDAAKFAKDMAALAEQAAAESHAEFVAAVRAESHAAAENFRALREMAEQFSAEALESVGTVQEFLMGSVLKEGERLREAAKALAEKMAQAREALANMVLTRSGDAPSVVQSGMQGFAAGGPLGAVAGVFIDLLTRSNQFKGIVEQVNNVIQVVADALGVFFEALGPVVGAVLNIAVIIANALKPAMKALGDLLAPLAPVFVMVGEVLGPLFSVLGAMLGSLVEVLKPIINVTMRALFEVLRGLGMVVLNVMIGIGNVWNGIINAVQSVFRALGSIEVFGGRPFQFLDNWATVIDEAKVDTDDYVIALMRLQGLTWEQAQAKAEELEQTQRQTKAQEALNESLLNAPRAWRIALNRYRAQDGQWGGSAPGGGGMPWPPVGGPPPTSGTPGPPSDSNGGGGGGPAPAPAPGGPSTVINITTHDVGAAGIVVARVVDEKKFRQRGSERGGMVTT